MDFQGVVRHRRTVRSYDPDRPVPPEVIDRIVGNGLRVPAHLNPIGAISIGYGQQPPRDLRSRWRPREDVVCRGRWT
jgi:nitroreductase